MTKKFEKCCAICGNQFLTSYGQQVVCSKQCKLTYRRNHHTSTTRQCVICGSDFTITMNTKHTKVCSTACHDKRKQFNRNKLNLNRIKSCTICSKEFLAIGNNRTCSDYCSTKSVSHRINLRYKNDINFKLTDVLRSRLNKAIRNHQKAGSAIDDLGCSVDELRVYLESKFQPGMTWDNYGFRGWHIDHIEPLSKFDLSDPEQFKIACHYTNLQPLWWRPNIVKGNKHV